MPEQSRPDPLAVLATVLAVTALPVYLALAAAVRAYYHQIAQPWHLHLAQFLALMFLGVAVATAYARVSTARWVLWWAVPAIAFLVPMMYTTVSAFFAVGVD